MEQLRVEELGGEDLRATELRATELRDWAARIESIGRNCEWGAIQRHVFGIEPISLLRWAGSADRALLARAFRDRFCHLCETMSGLHVPPWNPPEQQFYWLVDDTYNITFHTDEGVSQVSVETAVHKTRPRLRRMAEALCEKIEEQDACFIYADNDLSDPADAAELIAAFRSVGPARLLLVMADEQHSGTAHDLGDQVTLGRVAKLTELNMADQYKMPGWAEMLRAANEIARF